MAYLLPQAVTRDALILVNNISKNVFLYRIPSEAGSSEPYPAFTVLPSTASVTVAVGASVSVSWSAPPTATCVAKGSNAIWLGMRPTVGSEVLGPFTAAGSYQYVLTCTVGDFVLTESRTVVVR